MLAEAVQIIQRMFEGETVTFRGTHIEAAGARLWDLPPDAPPIGIACSGPRSARLAGEMADVMIAVTPEAGLPKQIGSASCRDRVGQYVSTSWVRVALKKKKQK